MTCCERLHTSANIAQQETTLLGPTMLRVVASVCTGLKTFPISFVVLSLCIFLNETFDVISGKRHILDLLKGCVGPS